MTANELECRGSALCKGDSHNCHGQEEMYQMSTEICFHVDKAV
jgi:hypothetical protein